jgi:hypothetical protein
VLSSIPVELWTATEKLDRHVAFVTKVRLARARPAGLLRPWAQPRPHTPDPEIPDLLEYHRAGLIVLVGMQQRSEPSPHKGCTAPDIGENPH